MRILQSPPSVRQSRYLFLNNWTKSNQIWCVSCSHGWGVQQHKFFAPPPGALGRGQKVGLSVCLSCYLFLNHWTKSNKIWCVSCSLEWGMQRQFFCAGPWGPVKGPKGQISLNFNYKVNFKDLKPNFVCLLTNER